jgi:hypothetical protein
MIGYDFFNGPLMVMMDYDLRIKTLYHKDHDHLRYLRSISLWFGFVSKNFIERYLEFPGNAKCKFKGRGVLTVFNGYDGLARNPCAVGQFLLGYFVVVKTELADIVIDITLGHSQTPFR